jgi:hypothetical protein
MRYVACLFVEFYLAAGALGAAEPSNSQLGTADSQEVGLQDTQNPEAHALYLKGRSYWAKRTRADLETAVSYFSQAIAKDPGYALAYAGLADAYAILPDYGATAAETTAGLSDTFSSFRRSAAATGFSR